MRQGGSVSILLFPSPGWGAIKEDTAIKEDAIKEDADG
jgi:hypothetical protein